METDQNDKLMLGEMFESQILSLVNKIVDSVPAEYWNHKKDDGKTICTFCQKFNGGMFIELEYDSGNDDINSGYSIRAGSVQEHKLSHEFEKSALNPSSFQGNRLLINSSKWSYSGLTEDTSKDIEPLMYKIYQSVKNKVSNYKDKQKVKEKEHGEILNRTLESII